MRSYPLYLIVFAIFALVSCRPPAAKLPNLPGIGTLGGFALEAVSPDGRWLVLCQAHEDTNGDGEIAVYQDMHHGFFHGDSMNPYLIFGAGAGTRLDTFVAMADDGRFLAVIRDGKLMLVDARGPSPRSARGRRSTAPSRRPA